MIVLSVLGWAVAAMLAGVAWTLWQRLTRAEAERLAMLERTRQALIEAEGSVRRVREEAERARPFAAEPVLRDLLAIVDDLDRAILAGEGGAGVAMIQRQSIALLQKHGAERVESVEQPFDPNAHEAVSTSPAPGPPDRVLAELSAGYRLHGRLLRPARVVVTVAEEPPDPASSVRVQGVD